MHVAKALLYKNFFQLESYTCVLNYNVKYISYWGSWSKSLKSTALDYFPIHSFNMLSPSFDSYLRVIAIKPLLSPNLYSLLPCVLYLDHLTAPNGSSGYPFHPSVSPCD